MGGVPPVRPAVHRAHPQPLARVLPPHARAATRNLVHPSRQQLHHRLPSSPRRIPHPPADPGGVPRAHHLSVRRAHPQPGCVGRRGTCRLPVRLVLPVVADALRVPAPRQAQVGDAALGRAAQDGARPRVRPQKRAALRRRIRRQVQRHHQTRRGRLCRRVLHPVQALLGHQPWTLDPRVSAQVVRRKRWRRREEAFFFFWCACARVCG
mmetsp:Transcript_3543/g.12727  ORF Transcript_3543/g.12727 Transcript_3543/m.12727 type:complete len:209 (+) Transcript_3543:1556-2182(+)